MPARSFRSTLIKSRNSWRERVVRRNLNVVRRRYWPRSGTNKEATESEGRLHPRCGGNFTRHLHSRVEITRKKKGGVIEINFSSEDDLIRLYEELTARGGNDEGEAAGELNGFLDRGSTYPGELEFEDTMRIDGRFAGKITSKMSKSSARPPRSTPTSMSGGWPSAER